MDVETVTDDLGLHIFVFYTGGNGTGSAVVDAGHGVVQVGHVGDTGIHGGTGLVVGAVGVGDGDGAQLAGLFHEFHGTGQLGSDVHNADQTVAIVIELLKAVEIRLLQVVGVLSATLLVGEVGAFHLDAHEAGVTLGSFGLQLLCGGKGLVQNIVGQGHGGGSEGGGTALGIVLGHGLQAFVIAVGEVGTGVAVAVNFYQTRDDGGAAQINGIGGNFFGQNDTEFAVYDFESTGMELKIRSEDTRVFIEHIVSLLYSKNGGKPSISLFI